MLKPKIEEGIPVPQMKWGALRETLANMQIGDSFFHVDRAYIQSHMCRIAQLINRRVTSRKVKENGVNGVRVWRVE